MTDAAPLNSVTRPTRLSEWTLVLALGAVWALAFAIVTHIARGPWPDAVAPDRIRWLGWGLIGALIVLGMLIAAFASPWVGTIKASGAGASLELDGKGGE